MTCSYCKATSPPSPSPRWASSPGWLQGDSASLVTRSAVARTRPEKDPPLLMRIYLCLFVLFQMFCIVIPCTSPLSYVVGVKHIVIEALPDLLCLQNIVYIHDS